MADALTSFANAVSLIIIVGTIASILSQEARARWRRRRLARAKPIEPFLGDCLPDESPP